jgi:predicted O-linked N-acetylglucosamine transferase (SPINDLY family)
MRERLKRAFDHFHDVRGQGDAAVARLMRENEIDIAVDLKGHTQDTRLGILAYRPCPVQATYLGFPATTGASFIDYVVADAVVAPFADAELFSEKIVHMPHSYQVNDAARLIAAQDVTRQALGLPDQAFVFCCFNNNWKISPAVFDVWMRLLQAVPGSVLWLLRDNDAAMDNLRRQAEARGVDADRLVFGERIAPADHLARHAAADLFLDTLPNNAHTTASDALWAGLPVLTMRGSSFSGRVAASLLGAVGLGELVTEDLAAYENLALALVRDPERLAQLRARLGVANTVHPLFDTRRFARDIERVFTRMTERARAGRGPEAFAI